MLYDKTIMWRGYKNKIIGLCLALLVGVPFIVFGAADKEFAATVGDFLNPNYWMDALRRSVNTPISEDTEIKVPTPEEALKEASPKLQEVNRDVREETGIDLAKFIGWLAKVIRAVFNAFADMLDLMARSFGG